MKIEVCPVVVNYEDSQKIYGLCLGGDDKDYIITDGKNKLFAFGSIDELVDYDKDKYVVYQEEVTKYNFDLISKSTYYENGTIDCNEILEAWNLFNDIAHTVKLKFIGDSKLYNYEYEKIFCGCNLPAVVKEGRIYTPIWRSKEIRRIFKVINNGISVYKKSKN